MVYKEQTVSQKMSYLIHAFQYEINKEVAISIWDSSTLYFLFPLCFWDFILFFLMSLDILASSGRNFELQGHLNGPFQTKKE